MGSIRGRRKAILMFSEGIDYPILDVFDSRDASTILSDTRDAIAAASKANVNFYTIDPRGLHTMGDENMELGGFPADPSYGINPQAFDHERRLAVDSLKVLAEQTGGFAAVESNDYSDAYDRIVRENSSYYVLGYYPPSNKRDGKFHKIEVKLKRPGPAGHRAQGLRGAEGQGRGHRGRSVGGDVDRAQGPAEQPAAVGRADAVGRGGAVRRAEGQRRGHRRDRRPQPQVHAGQGPVHQHRRGVDAAARSARQGADRAAAAR